MLTIAILKYYFAFPCLQYLLLVLKIVCVGLLAYNLAKFVILIFCAAEVNFMVGLDKRCAKIRVLYFAASAKPAEGAPCISVVLIKS